MRELSQKEVAQDQTINCRDEVGTIAIWLQLRSNNISTIYCLYETRESQIHKSNTQEKKGQWRRQIYGKFIWEVERVESRNEVDGPV